MNDKDKVEFVLERNVVEVLGDDKVTGIKLDKEHNGSDTIAVDGVFIEIGSIPATDLSDKLGCEKSRRKGRLQKRTAGGENPGELIQADYRLGSSCPASVGNGVHRRFLSGENKWRTTLELLHPTREGVRPPETLA